MIADHCGNTDTCSHTIFKGDISPPQLECPSDISVLCPEDAPEPFETLEEFISAGGKFVDNGQTDPSTFTVSQVIIGDGCPMDIVRTYQVSDLCGFTVECTHTITVNDNIPPVMVCPPDADYECLTSESKPFTSVEAFVAAGGTISDNCAIDSSSFMMFEETIVTTQTSIEITRHYSVQDLCGNIAECLHTINSADTIPPQVVCTDLTVQLDETGTYVMVAAELHYSSFDECGIDTMYLERYILDCDDLGENLIKLYVVDISGNIDSCTAQVTVMGNTPPVAVDDNVSAMPEIPVEIDIIANDYDTGGKIDPATVTLVQAPANGTAEINPVTGVVTYTPESGFSDIDTFIYSVCDDGIPCGVMCDTAMVFVNVGRYNNPPEAQDDEYTVMCYPLTGNLMENDYDPDGDAIFMEPIPVEYPSNGKVLLDRDGSFHYMPDDGFMGVDSFVYMICDRAIPSLCDIAKVIITVLPDTDCDGIPDYDDIDPDCSLLIPDGFSPNGDGIHDFFQIFCIHKYPDAIMRIFDRAGNKLFEKQHYGNLDYWGSDQEAWWWGTSDNKWIIGTGRLPAGTYLYVLELGNGEVRTGTVMLAY